MILTEAIKVAEETGCFFYNNNFAYRFEGEKDHLACYIYHGGKTKGIELNGRFDLGKNIFTLKEVADEWQTIMYLKNLYNDKPQRRTLTVQIREAIKSKKLP